MKITILGSGTSTGVPEIGCQCEVCLSTDPKDKRLRSSILIEKEGTVLLIDCGPDFRCQMLNWVKDLPVALLITHHHYDHVGGLDDLRPLTRIENFRVYANNVSIKQLQETYAYMFAAYRYPGIPLIDLIEIGTSDFEIDGVRITPIRLFHHKLPTLGFRIDDFAYLTDFSKIHSDDYDKLKGVKTLIIEAVRLEPHIAHLTLDEAIDFANEIGAKEVYFTHLSHYIGKHKIVNKQLPSHMQLAYDGMEIIINKHNSNK